MWGEAEPCLVSEMSQGQDRGPCLPGLASPQCLCPDLEGLAPGDCCTPWKPVRPPECWYCDNGHLAEWRLAHDSPVCLLGPMGRSLPTEGPATLVHLLLHTCGHMASPCSPAAGLTGFWGGLSPSRPRGAPPWSWSCCISPLHKLSPRGLQENPAEDHFESGTFDALRQLWPPLLACPRPTSSSIPVPVCLESHLWLLDLGSLGASEQPHREGVRGPQLLPTAASAPLALSSSHEPCKVTAAPYIRNSAFCAKTGLGPGLPLGASDSAVQAWCHTGQLTGDPGASGTECRVPWTRPPYWAG